MKKAIAGFEKVDISFNQPIGYGYDDGINSAIQVCKLLDNEELKLGELISSLQNLSSPTMGPFAKMRKSMM